MMKADIPARFPTARDFRDYIPIHVVWEVTLACDLRCRHCGSRAGKRRPTELATAECLDVVAALARLGTREVTLIGGEAYLRRDWLEIIRAIRSHGMYCGVQTGARNLTAARIEAAASAGLNGIGISLDGLAPLHDSVRNLPGSFERAISALGRVREAGLAASVNTQIGADTMRDLPGLMETIIALGVSHWQLQLTVAMGNAADNSELLLQPHQLLDLMPLLAGLYQEAAARGLLISMGNNVGYFGPYEHLWRGLGDERLHWTGCSAGHTGLALEADGTVKGCPSLATVGYAGGNVRDLTLDEIWRSSEVMHRTRNGSTTELWGFCQSCYYADVCRGGCTWTAHSLFGVAGNNPYCHYRALELEKQGLRERVAKIKEAPEKSFAVGEFELVVEKIDDPGIFSRVISPGSNAGRGERPTAAVLEGKVPQRLGLCRGCSCYVNSDEIVCPHCGADVKTAAALYERQRIRRADATAALMAALRAAGALAIEAER
ncbi:GDL motif peptide-associated radical SAM/SPASM maturase [uncultured Bradyrhizobium sp.]|uniref:GDL motif peptide-associated radical SAM/SPASM maturase n=1 Tax=uncultured Bradyrhizobium sp. TaxID=199684 RepID=UPI0035CC0276